MDAKRFLSVLLLLLSLLSFGCSRKAEKPEISASIFPLAWLVKQIYPDYGVYQIVKPGANPHVYDLTPRDAVELEKSLKVFVVGNLEPFAERIPPNKRVEVLKLLNLPPKVNPHLWLSPKRWLKLAEILPREVEGLKYNPESWRKTLERLKKLDEKYESLKNFKAKVILLLPAAYWLCRDYGIEVELVLQPNPVAGISPKNYSKLVEILKKNPRVAVIYLTTNPRGKKLAEMLKREFPSLRVVGINPLIWETEGDYVSLMGENLKKLERALKPNLPNR